MKLRPRVCLLLASSIGCLALALVEPATSDPATAKEWHPPRTLELNLTGDSADFRLIDPTGHVAVLAVDSSDSEIPGCSISTYYDNMLGDHDDTDTTEVVDTTGTMPPPFGGGHIIFEASGAGVWHLEARVNRSCADTCSIDVELLSLDEGSDDLNHSVRLSLRTGEFARWKIVVPPAEAHPARFGNPLVLEAASPGVRRRLRHSP